MKKILVVIMAIAILATTVTAFAEENSNSTSENSQMQMWEGPQHKNRSMGHGAPKGQAPEMNGEKPDDLPEMNGEKPNDLPEMNGQAPTMIDFDAMVTQGVISQETCDKIKAYMSEHKPENNPEKNNEKPADMPTMNGQAPTGGKPTDLPEGEKPSGAPENDSKAPVVVGLLDDLLKDGVISQDEYDALVAAQQ